MENGNSIRKIFYFYRDNTFHTGENMIIVTRSKIMIRIMITRII